MKPIVVLLVDTIEFRMKGLSRSVAVNGPHPKAAGRVRADLILAMASRHPLGWNPDFVLPRSFSQIEEDGSLSSVLAKDLSEEGHGFPQDFRRDDRQEELRPLRLFLKP